MNNRITFSRTLRVVTLLVVLINIVFNYTYPLLPLGLMNMQAASDQYKGIFTPADYAFSIWGLIYLSFILYCIWQLRSKQLLIPGFNKISFLLILSNLFSILWICLFTSDHIGASVVVILIMLGLAILMYRFSQKEYEYSFWKRIPFSLYLGWLSVATIANLSGWMISQGWRSTTQEAEGFAMGFIFIVFLLGLYLSIKFRDLVYPAVLSWAVLAIWAANRITHPNVASVALVSSVSLFLLCGIFRISDVIHHRHRIKESH